MEKLDIHTHSAFSADGVSPLHEMLARAKETGLSYYGVSEHFDYDYRENGILACGKPVPMIDAPAYFKEARRLQKEYASKGLTVLAGGEFGYSSNPRCIEAYQRVIETYRPDFVVNSVHTAGGFDCYFQEYFAGKDRNAAYLIYLQKVLHSLDAPYDYDIVAHLGYVTRNAPYENKKLRYEEFAPVIDEILKKIIAKGKILEVNASARGAGSEFLPDTDILKRYFALGGRAVSFSSDAHDVSRIGDKFCLITAALKQIGFPYYTVPIQGRHIQVPID